MSTKKVHAIGPRKIGTLATTACNAYLASGAYAVEATKYASAVTCKACLKALKRARP